MREFHTASTNMIIAATAAFTFPAVIAKHARMSTANIGSIATVLTQPNIFAIAAATNGITVLAAHLATFAAPYKETIVAVSASTVATLCGIAAFATKGSVTFATFTHIHRTASSPTKDLTAR